MEESRSWRLSGRQSLLSTEISLRQRCQNEIKSTREYHLLKTYEPPQCGRLHSILIGSGYPKSTLMISQSIQSHILPIQPNGSIGPNLLFYDNYPAGISTVALTGTSSVGKKPHFTLAVSMIVHSAGTPRNEQGLRNPRM